MQKPSLLAMSFGSALLVGSLAAGCSTQAPLEQPGFPDGDAGDQESTDKSYIEAAFTINNLIPDQQTAAGYRAVNSGAPTSGDFELWFSPRDNPSEVAHVERVENAPFGEAALRIPADLQGEFYISAWIYGSDGSVFTTADLVQGPDGEFLYPDAPRPQIDLRFGTVSDLIFVFFEQLSFDDGTVSLNSHLTMDLVLTAEQQAMMDGLDDARGTGILSGCLAFGATETRGLRYDPEAGTLTWEDVGDDILLVGHTCTYEVKIQEDGAARLSGGVEFVAPAGDGRVHELGMELRVVDAFIDAAFDVRGITADTQFTLSDELVTYLDESQWESGLRYVLTADNGHSAVLEAELSRDGFNLGGTLTPIDEFYPTHVVTLQILDGSAVVLEGDLVVDFFDSAALHFSLDYELNVVIGAKNLTNVHFNAWLADNPDATSGVRVTTQMSSPEGFTFYSECLTGSLAAYSCRLEMPTFSTGTVTYSADGYTSVTHELDVSTLESINLPYVSLVQGGSTGM